MIRAVIFELAREGFLVDDAAYAEAERWAVETFAPSLYRAVIWRLTRGDQAASKRLYDAMQERSHDRDLLELRDGIADVLQGLKARGLVLGLAANQPANRIEMLATLGIGHYFANPGVSGVYGFRKPDVRLLLRACSDLGVEPSQCIMVGDRIDNDVVPAKTLGMRTVLLRTGRHREQQPRSWDERPDVEVVRTEELLPAILSLVDENEG